MNSYTDVDGVPVAADERLLTELLRGELGFSGVVVADYYAVSFLETRHGVAGSRGAAGALALTAGIDVELPTARCYGEPLTDARTVGRRTRGAHRPGRGTGPAAEGRTRPARPRLGTRQARAGRPRPAGEPGTGQAPGRAVHRAARQRRHPAAAAVPASRSAGRTPTTPTSFLGCYSFPNHVAAARRPRAGDPDARRGTHRCRVHGRRGRSGRERAGARRPGRACSAGAPPGEGCDAETLDLPGDQAALASAVLDSGVPTVLVLVSGRPYALGTLAERAAAVVQAFFPGEEGGTALARIISGAAEPSGRLPVSIPRQAGGQPGTYLHATLGGHTDWSSVDPTPLFPFGHGLSWTSFTCSELSVDPVAADGRGRLRSATVRNVGEVAGTEVVQLYLSDPVASVVRPRRWLAGFGRVELQPGEAARITFSVHADRTSFTGLDLRRRVEPGEIGVAVGRSSGDLPLQGSFTLEGPVRHPAADRVLSVPVEIVPVP